jgi:ceramide glucosyltransferase
VSGTLALGLAGLLLGWATVVAATSGVAIGRALGRRRGTSRPAAVGPVPRVLVVRPCAGLEPHLRRSLGSTAALRYDGPLRIVLSTSTADDPACPVLHAVASDLRAEGLDVAVQVVPPQGPNLKASQLAGLVDDADADVAVVIDSDVELPSLDLARLLAPLRDQETRVAAVWCPPVEREPASLGDRMSAAVLGGSLHAFALLGTLDRAGLVGKTFAVRVPVLRAVGGFRGLVSHLGEDMELARRLAVAGWSTAMSDVVVASLASRRRVGQVLARYARWLLVIRAQRPALLWSYPLLLAATPGLVLGGAIGMRSGLPGAGAAVGLAVVSRLAVATAAAVLARRHPTPGRALLDAVLADAVLLAAFARALGPARARWRDRSLHLGTHGVLEPQRGRPEPPGMGRE